MSNVHVIAESLWRVRRKLLIAIEASALSIVLIGCAHHKVIPKWTIPPDRPKPGQVLLWNVMTNNWAWKYPTEKPLSSKDLVQ